MQITYKQATTLFNEIDPKLKIPSQHPTYLQIDCKREKEAVPTYFVYEESGYLYYHAFHVTPVFETAFYDIQSPYGYGGPVSTSQDKGFLERAWSYYKSWCKKNNIMAEFIRFHPVIGNWEYYYGVVHVDRETVWIDLREDDLVTGYQSKTRNMLRKAIKSGLTVEWYEKTEFFKLFSPLYENLMNQLQASDFYNFSAEYYDAWIQSDFGQYAICKKDGEVVAASVFYYCDDIMEYHLSASNEIGKKYAANTLLLHEAGKRGKELGCKLLHLGGGTNNLPDNALHKFKAGFSNHRGLYHIGKYIHLPDVYENLKAEWQDKKGEVSNRILFYR